MTLTTPFRPTTNSATRKQPTVKTCTRRPTIPIKSHWSRGKQQSESRGRLKMRTAKAINMQQRSVDSECRETTTMKTRRCATQVSFAGTLTIHLNSHQNSSERRVRPPNPRKTKSKRSRPAPHPVTPKNRPAAAAPHPRQRRSQQASSRASTKLASSRVHLRPWIRDMIRLQRTNR